MDMKEQTRNSVLTAMVCIALSSGTAWAAVPEEPVPVVQQKSLTGTVSDQAAELRSMPLYWSALKPKEEQVKKAQPVIITAEDIEAKRKEEKRAAAAQAAKGAQKKPAAESNVQPQPVAAPKPAEAAHVQPVNKPVSGTPAQAQPVKPASSVPVQAQAAPMTDIAPAQAQPAKPAIGVPPQPQQPATPPAQPAVPASKPQSQTPEAKPQVAAPVSKPQAQPVPQHENKTPPQPALPPASPQEPVLAVTPKRQMVQIHPEGLYASRRQDPVAGQVPQEQKQPAYRDEGYEKSQAQPQQPERTVQQPLPKQIQVERPPEFEGISDEVVRHIMAGEYAMRYQLSRDASEPGVYRLTQVLNRNTGLSHLQKIEYLMGFGRAINRSKLSEYQKKALIDAVIQSFGEK
ncbi:MAG: hypothetical protein E7200_03775 [Selenomonas ruminantium]|nr:hypothetical protein [Selenomonas ruminantium]